MIVFIILLIILIVVAFKILKPYFIKYDTTILFTGGLGSGKTLNSVKYSVKLYKVSCRKIRLKNWFTKILRLKRRIIPMPILVSNVPIYTKTLFKGRVFISVPLTRDMLTLNERIPEFSIVLIDEISNIANQFNWSIEDVQYHVNEFIQFFRHYVGGYLILNAQAESEIVKQIRVKLNSYYICMNFRKFLFFFYRVDLLHRLCTGGEDVNVSNFIDEDIKRKYGILFNNYDSRYLSDRYLNVKKECSRDVHKKQKVNKLIRFKQYKSKCDDVEDI